MKFEWEFDELQRIPVIVPEHKECPFCGSKDTNVHTDVTYGANVISMVICENCEAQGPHIIESVKTSEKRLKVKTIKAWNNRC